MLSQVFLQVCIGIINKRLFSGPTVMPITTIPPFDNVIASGYWPLTVSVTVLNPLRTKLLCYWIVSPSILFQFIVDSVSSCRISSTDSLADVTCLNSGKIVRSNLTFVHPLRSGTLIVGFGCYSSLNFSSFENFLTRLRNVIARGELISTNKFIVNAI